MVSEDYHILKNAIEGISLSPSGQFSWPLCPEDLEGRTSAL